MAAKDDNDDLIGITIAGRYRIISRLGAGGMGTAYRAWDEQDGVPVVIKIPKKVFFEDPKFAERFRREIRLLRGLVHPHIVPIVDEGEHEGLPFVVMRFLPGGSLSNRRLRDERGKVRPNPPGMLLLWLPAVAEALDAIHAGGVVHRDVKPANIFFDAGWGAFVGDFGIAKIIAESDVFDREHTLTATGMGIGTPDYMAPEQFAPKAVVDGRADQYALAVIVFEMLAGVRPFTGEATNLLLEVMTQPAPKLNEKRSGMPPSLIAAVDRGLAKRPEARFATCSEFADAVLQDVPPIEDEVGVARLLCPKCGNLLKLPESAAGKTGKCPKCKSDMKVAADLGAMWLLDEARRQEESASAGWTALGGSAAGNGTDSQPSLETLRPVSGTTVVGKAARRSRQGILAWVDGHGLIMGGVLALAALIPWVLSKAEIQRLQVEKQQAKKQLTEATKSNDALREEIKALEDQIKKLQAELAAVRPAPSKEPAETVPAPVVDLAARVPMFLCDMPVKRSFVSWDQLQVGRIPNLQINGKVYGKVIKADASSLVVFDLPDGFEGTLQGKVGIAGLNKDGNPPSCCRFQILGGEQMLWQSGTIAQDKATGLSVVEQFSVNIKGLKTITLEVDSLGSNLCDWSVWIDPVLLWQGTNLSDANSAQAILAQPPLVNSIGMKLKLIPAGTFQMGSDDGEPDQKPVHEARITKPFYLGVTEVTNAQWKAVMGDVPSNWKDDDLPVEQVSWDDAVKFCEKLSALAAEKAAGRVYRLPTEAEWEYACRGGTRTTFSFGEDEGILGEFAWFAGNSGNQTHAVGLKKPNPWGLHDMHGNVWEWCSDWYGPYGGEGASDPTGPATGSGRVSRGGSWDGTAWYCRSARRVGDEPSFRDYYLGFRLALSPSTSNPQAKSSIIDRSLWRSTAAGHPKVFRRDSATAWSELQPNGVRYRFVQSAETPEYIELKCDAGRDLRIRLRADGSDLQQNGGDWGRWYAGGWFSEAEIPAWVGNALDSSGSGTPK